MEREREREREDLWSKLGDIRALWSNPCCIGRDLNVCQIPRGKKKFEDHR